MPHTKRDKKKLLNRIRRIKGQINAIERALEDEEHCAEVLQLIAGCRGAMNGLMLVVLEGHLRTHVLDPEQPPTPEQSSAAESMVELLKTYLR